MTDTIIKGAGNSRSIRSVPNLGTLAPTYEKLLELLTGDGLPIDLGPLNSAGCDVVGTSLNKANVLTNTTATGMGLTSSATPNQAFAKLRQLIQTAQNSADTALSTKIDFMTGSYVGTGKAGSANPVSIRLTRSWKMCVVVGLTGSSRSDSIGTLLLFSGAAYGTNIYYSGGSSLTVEVLHMSEAGNTVSFYDYNSIAKTQYNAASETYKWWAI